MFPIAIGMAKGMPIVIGTIAIGQGARVYIPIAIGMGFFLIVHSCPKNKPHNV